MSLDRTIIGAAALGVLVVSPLEASLIPKHDYEIKGQSIPEQSKRYTAFHLLNQGTMHLKNERFHDAYHSLNQGLNLLEMARDIGGDFDYAEANYRLGRWYFEVAQSKQNLSHGARSRLFNSAVSYFDVSEREFEHVRRDPSQQSNANLLQRLFDLNRYMTDAYYALGNFKNASNHIIKVIQQDPRDYYVGILVNLSSRLRGKDNLELIQKIYSSFDKSLADRIIRIIIGLTDTQTDFAVGTSGTSEDK